MTGAYDQVRRNLLLFVFNDLWNNVERAFREEKKQQPHKMGLFLNELK